MKLDRETEALLFWVSSSTTKPLWQMDPESARAEYRRSLSKTDVGPIKIGASHDLEISGPAGPIPIRTYSAAAPSGASILFFHGGGGVLGDIATHDTLCRALCHDTGASVFSVDYRLAPEHPFPTAVYDGVASLEWLSANAETLSLDPARIAVAGDSAGGSLAAVALHETKGRLVAPAAAQLLIYPALDLRAKQPSRKELVDQFPIPEEMLYWFFNHYFGTAWPISDPRAIPALYEDYTGLPPTLIVTAGHDPFRDEGLEYAERLESAGVPIEYVCYEGTVHGFMNMGRMLRVAYRTMRQRMSTWLKEQLDAPGS
ncbi:MAG: alpha/beta hydrolase [Methyloceanibacter sp.]|uniref:alpha/beta hydrolase n=1 Tax=Methyloceanibacter sp. TaxID=1965321 RepID=UPI001D34F6D7|nr:alpha/beta hydrolase [Methyloceanibacter sp.]MCB1442573.1 alpha/beta hydrolase [Methyloceanibacter sp.]MCC0059482.1 alpha/beta hydrolase [Hyphomicrobiaceae bacterium]